VYTVTKQSHSASAGHGVTLGANHQDVYFTGAVNAPADVYVAHLTGGTGAAPEVPGHAARSSLALRIPNPARGDLAVRYAIPQGEAAPAVLTVYDISGRPVRTQVEGVPTAGEHSIAWDGTDHTGASVPGGVYFFELRWNGRSQVQRALLLR
ncbi:MAG: T9SS type A sorting domain-containing protein, partial [Candidatus Eisenbacteria bacterium]|nr:T9SS type A sorting domain-containing protein [Candidatus Eisenbacteria bacterium]